MADHGQLRSVTILADEHIKCVRISITDDAIEEDVELFHVSIFYSFSLTANPRIYTTTEAVIIIIYDDDCKSMALMQINSLYLYNNIYSNM